MWKKVLFSVLCLVATSSSASVAAGAVELIPGATSVTKTATISHVWEQFFSGTTPAARKVALLQDGAKFATILKAQASSSLAESASARVLGVTATSSSTAKVVYSIYLAGKPVLVRQTGIAVRVGGSWKVGDQSFCALLSLEGVHTNACR